MSKHKKKFFSSSLPLSNPKPNESLAKFAITAQHFSGPIPPPEMMRKYEELLPGSADRIIAMAERQSNHRQSLESKVISSNCFNERLGMIFGFAICLLAISAGAYLILHGKNASGIVSIMTAIVGPVSVFIYGKSRQKKDLQDRREAIIRAASNIRT